MAVPEGSWGPDLQRTGLWKEPGNLCSHQVLWKILKLMSPETQPAPWGLPVEWPVLPAPKTPRPPRPGRPGLTARPFRAVSPASCRGRVPRTAVLGESTHGQELVRLSLPSQHREDDSRRSHRLPAQALCRRARWIPASVLRACYWPHQAAGKRRTREGWSLARDTQRVGRGAGLTPRLSRPPSPAKLTQKMAQSQRWNMVQPEKGTRSPFTQQRP